MKKDQVSDYTTSFYAQDEWTPIERLKYHSGREIDSESELWCAHHSESIGTL